MSLTASAVVFAFAVVKVFDDTSLDWVAAGSDTFFVTFTGWGEGAELDTGVACTEIGFGVIGVSSSLAADGGTGLLAMLLRLSDGGGRGASVCSCLTTGTMVGSGF